MDDELQRVLAERDNYHRALYAAERATSEHNVAALGDRLLITRGAAAIMREVLRGGTFTAEGTLLASPEAERVAALEARVQELETIVRLARERLYDADGGRGSAHTAQVVRAVHGILRRVSEGEERVVDEGGGVWRVRLDGGLRVDTFHGLARAANKIPPDVRRGGGKAYKLIEELTRDGHRWARIRVEDTADA